jgi:hypothetical protein
MINILVSLAVFFAIKYGFLYLFAPKGHRNRLILDARHSAKHHSSLVERRDRPRIGSSLRSKLQAENLSGVVDMNSATFNLDTTQQLVEGQS